MIKELFNQNVDELVNAQREKVASVIKKYNNGFIIFGTTELGNRTLAGLRRVGIEPLAFVDDNIKTHGTRIDGISVFPLDDALTKFGKNVVYILAMSRSVSTRKRLHSLKIPFISFAELTWYYADVFLPCFNLDLPYKMFKQSDIVIDTVSIWADEKSKKEYTDQIKWRMNLDSNKLSLRNPLDELYFPPNILELKSTEILVDCGAFDGDTIRSFIEIQPLFNHIIAIEPDVNNYTNLCMYISSLPDGIKNKITSYNVAVGKEKKKISFNMTGDMGASIGGNETIDCDTIDNLKLTPTYIKMDIEGFELDALLGSFETIKKYSPVLAICLYHRPDDLWKIPFFIHFQYPEYKLFLRRYLDDSWETVCYAVPPHRLRCE